jgi:hypothetical protein
VPRLPRALGRAAVATALTVGSLGAAAALAPSAQAATTVNCDTAAQPSANWTLCTKLVGTAKCVWNNGNGTYTLAVGYTNPTTSSLYANIPVNGTGGANNKFTATSGFAANPSHFDTFTPGVSTTAFTVTWSPTSSTDPVTWVLMGKTYTWNRTYTACVTKPVPVIGGVGGFTLGLLGLVAVGAFGGHRVRRAVRAVPLVGRPVTASG